MNTSKSWHGGLYISTILVRSLHALLTGSSELGVQIILRQLSSSISMAYILTCEPFDGGIGYIPLLTM